MAMAFGIEYVSAALRAPRPGCPPEIMLRSGRILVHTHKSIDDAEAIEDAARAEDILVDLGLRRREGGAGILSNVVMVPGGTFNMEVMPDNCFRVYDTAVRRWKRYVRGDNEDLPETVVLHFNGVGLFCDEECSVPLADGALRFIRRVLA